jgi:UDP-N-acetylmuramate-alanine ligase
MALPGVTSEALVRKIEMLGARAFCCSEKDVCELIDREKIDCLVLMGAGNLDRIKERINGRCAR